MRRNARGFTLIELMTSMAVLAIAAGFALPALQSFVARSRAMAAASELTSTLAHARMTAIAKGGTTVCPSLDGRSCSDGSDWSAGWIAFRGGSTERSPASQDQLLTARTALPKGVRVLASAGRTRLHYLPTGLASGTNVTLSICVGTMRLEKVIMNNAGRVRTERDSDPCPSP